MDKKNPDFSGFFYARYSMYRKRNLENKGIDFWYGWKYSEMDDFEFGIVWENNYLVMNSVTWMVPSWGK